MATINETIVGGDGIAPIADFYDTCELKKLFLLKKGRSLGIGKTLVTECLDFAFEQNYSRWYLDTLANMTSTIALYQKFDF